MSDLLAVLLPHGRIVACLNTVAYELADGDLILTSRLGRRLVYPPGAWAAVGTLEDSDSVPWLAIEETSSVFGGP